MSLVGSALRVVCFQERPLWHLHDCQNSAWSLVTSERAMCAMGVSRSLAGKVRDVGEADGLVWCAIDDCFFASVYLPDTTYPLEHVLERLDSVSDILAAARERCSCRWMCVAGDFNTELRAQPAGMDAIGRRVGGAARVRSRSRMQEKRSQHLMNFLLWHDLVATNTWCADRFCSESCTWWPAGSERDRTEAARVIGRVAHADAGSSARQLVERGARPTQIDYVLVSCLINFSV